MTDSTENLRSRPVLIIVSNDAHMHADVRSRNRDVRRWRSDMPVGVEGPYFGGDPEDSRCFEWTAEARAVTAVIDLQPADRAKRVLGALRKVRPDAAVLLLTPRTEDVDGPFDGTLARAGELRDVLRVDLEEELERLEAERRAYCLQQFAQGPEVVPILIHPDPDPDAVSSALAVAALLGGPPERTPIVTLDDMTRPENRRMAELLHIRVTTVTLDELRKFDRVIAVDTQPRDLQRDGRPRVAVIDHHPLENSYRAEYLDVRPEYGATATMMTEYLRAVSGDRLSRGLATALLFGIRTDTSSLMRGVTPADVAAYAFLQQRADLALVRRFEQPSWPLETARRFGRALAGADCEADLCVAWLDTLGEEDSHVMADLADFLLSVENVTWVVVGAVLENELVLTLRYAGHGAGAGEVARVLARNGGSGGGHATMARAVLPVERAEGISDEAAATAVLRRLVTQAVEEVSRPALPQARPA